MVKTKKIKILSVLLVGIIALFAVAFLSVVKKGESVYAAEVSVSGIRTEYLYKDTVSIPKTATVTIDGQDYELDFFTLPCPTATAYLRLNSL